jgi:alcohol dehydrogenase (NADP+)
VRRSYHIQLLWSALALDQERRLPFLDIGGLGHFGLLWAKALGAEVWALSHSPNKKAEALKLGADHFISTGDKDWAKDHAFTFNFILHCADMTNEFDMKTYMSTLAVNGKFHNVGLPDKPLPKIIARDFAPNGSKICESHIGSEVEALATLKLASEKNIHPMIEKNDVPYRVTLTGFKKAFGTA